MADINEEVSAISAQLGRLNSEFDRYSTLTAGAASATRQRTEADYLVKQAAQGAGQSLQTLTRSVGSFAGAVYEGQLGVESFNNSIGQVGGAVGKFIETLALLIPGGLGVKALGAAAVTAVGALTDLAKKSNLQAQQEYETYNKLSGSGTIASEGMSGVANSAAKTGLSISKLGNYINLVNSNSQELAMFGKSAFDGRRKFDNLSLALEGEREKLFALGMTQDEINEGMMGYIRLQNLAGKSQKMTTDELVDGTRKYLYEQDALTKLLGMSRKEQQAVREAALSEQRFGAKIAAMKASGDADQIAAAEQLEQQNLALAKVSPALAQGFRDLTTGMMNTEAAQKANTSTQGQILTDIRDVTSGAKKGIEGAYSTLGAAGETAKKFNMSYQTGEGEKFLIPFKEAQLAQQYTDRKALDEFKAVLLEQDKTGKGPPGTTPTDPLLKDYAALIKDNQDIMTLLQQTLQRIDGKLLGLNVAGVPGQVQQSKDLANLAKSLLVPFAAEKGIYLPKDDPDMKPKPVPKPESKPVPPAPTTAEKTNKIVDAANAVEQAKIDEAAAEKRFKEKKLEVAEAEKKLASLDEATALKNDLIDANDKLVTARKEQAAAVKALENAVKSRSEAEEKLQAVLKADKPVAPNTKQTTTEAPNPAADAAAEKIAAEKIAAAKAAAEKIAAEKAAKSNPATVAPLTVANLPSADKMSREQKEAINNILQNTRLPDRVTKNKAGEEVVVPGLPDGQRPIFDLNDPVRGNDDWKGMVKNLSPDKKKWLVDEINKEVENILKKKAAEKTSESVVPNDRRMNDAAGLKADQVAALGPNVKNIPSTSDLAIESDVATINSKSMNIRLDNPADVARMLTETMTTKIDIEKKYQPSVGNSFESSFGDIKNALSNQNNSNEMLLAAIQELIRVQRSGVSVNEKILAAQA